MKIVRTSPVTKSIREIEINVTYEQLERWRNGELIQNVMPELTPDEREFIMSGITPNDWDNIFGADT